MSAPRVTVLCLLVALFATPLVFPNVNQNAITQFMLVALGFLVVVSDDGGVSA